VFNSAYRLQASRRRPGLQMSSWPGTVIPAEKTGHIQTLDKDSLLSFIHNSQLCFYHSLLILYFICILLLLLPT